MSVLHTLHIMKCPSMAARVHRALLHATSLFAHMLWGGGRHIKAAAAEIFTRRENVAAAVHVWCFSPASFARSEV